MTTRNFKNMCKRYWVYKILFSCFVLPIACNTPTVKKHENVQKNILLVSEQDTIPVIERDITKYSDPAYMSFYLDSIYFKFHDKSKTVVKYETVQCERGFEATSEEDYQENFELLNRDMNVYTFDKDFTSEIRKATFVESLFMSCKSFSFQDSDFREYNFKMKTTEYDIHNYGKCKIVTYTSHQQPACAQNKLVLIINNARKELIIWYVDDLYLNKNNDLVYDFKVRNSIHSITKIVYDKILNVFKPSCDKI